MAKRALGRATWQIVQAVRRTADPVRSWLVACSGGRDSLALAVAAHHARPGTVTGLVVDHGLQPGSAEIARGVRDQLGSAGVPAEVVRVDVGSDGGPEAAARDARYAALRAEAAAQGADLLLGHTMDDQAETVLIGLARGSGARSLAGMAVRYDEAGVVLVRPMLELRRAVTAEACVELGLRWWDDPHNADPRFARSRVRMQVMPALESELGPGIVEALARTARLLRDDADLLDAQAAAAFRAGRGAIPLECADVSALPTALRRRVLLAWLRDCGARDLGEVHVVEIDRLLTEWRGQGPLDVPGLRVERRDGALRAVALP